MVRTNNIILTALFLIVVSLPVFAQSWWVQEQHTHDGGVVVIVYNSMGYQLYCEIQSDDGAWVDFFVAAGYRTQVDVMPGISQPYKFYSRYTVRCE